MAADITLILGGARSGKSRFGEDFALQTGLTPIYIATAEPSDNEMETRIAHHQSSRDSAWRLVEEPLELSAALTREAGPKHIILIDCITIWLSNHLINGSELEEVCADLTHTLQSAAGPIVLVSNEVGAGVVPAYASGRTFRDAAGRLNQELARISQDVFYIVAGLPLALKSQE